MAEYAEIIKDLQKGKYAPVYFLQGDEPFFIDNITENIEHNALDDTQKSFNQYVLYGKDVTFTDVLNVARKYPMMGERQVVIVKEAQDMRDWKKEDPQKMLIAYLENPLPTTILVFGHKYKTLDRRTKISKALEKNAVFLNSKRIYDDKVPGWVRSYAQATGANVTEKAIMILTENIGNNLQRLANEINKLKLNVEDGQQIDEVAVQKYVGISKDYNTFELQKAISLRDEVKVMKIVQYFDANPSSNPLIMVIANLYSYFTKLLLIHHQGASDKNAVARAIGVNPFFATEYMQAARNYPAHIVIRNIQLIHQADLQSKGIGYAPMKDGNILKELIFKLMH
ncbi:DNA polymerase III subunit delta [Marinoscillum furvescens]|uniref:DNA polymerase III subunit delta n=1 Tax=Marinoscillum furvescens DSM 4134 TaxID=1122208 RepID=A0A3D9KYN0_MARFU|nr:DNA polymerase III subunit delta [Marinoscillum furvescens]RED94913.1 DNA polymerase III delta subunit [Marinoscillum furvescens DSM 4134]